MIAHRGASTFELENTKEAFIAAGNRPFYGIETDVSITKDKKIVVFHDLDLIRLASRPDQVVDLTLADLKKIPLQGGFDHINFYHIPSFKEYLRICKHYHKKCVIELKWGFDQKAIQHLFFEIETEGMYNSCIIISFSIEYLYYIRSIHPNFPLQYLKGDIIDEEILTTCQKYRFDLDIHKDLVTPDIVDFMHKNNLKVNTWTVDDPREADFLTDMGVDFITSNVLTSW